MAAASFTFLGTGTSVGVPVIGCDCPVCTSENPKNRRLRSSALVKCGSTTLLVDSGPDLRAQALRERITAIDAVLYTHAHLDHVAGFDELRAFCWHKPHSLPIHAAAGCMSTLMRMFDWAFAADNQYKGYVKPDPRVIDGPFQIGGFRVTPLPVEHAAVETIGYLFQAPGHRSLAYIPDVKRIPPATLELIRGVDVIALDCLRPSPHPTHFSLNEALAIISQIDSAEAWLTHLGHENDHDALDTRLPPGVHVAWDGLQIPL